MCTYGLTIGTSDFAPLVKFMKSWRHREFAEFGG